MDQSQTIRDVMDMEGVSPHEIPYKTSKQGVRGFSEIVCINSRCNWTWSTHRAHIVFDLKNQRVDKIWKQKCKKCGQEQVPSFKDMEFTKLLEKAIEQEQKFRNNTNNVFADDDDDGNGRRGKPHESSLCEKCGYGRTQCWIKKPRPF